MRPRGARPRTSTGIWLSSTLLLCVTAVASKTTLFGDDKELFNMLEIRNQSNRAVVITLAGTGQLGAKDGSGKEATFWTPSDVSLLPNGRAFLVADTRNHKIRSVTIPSAGQTQSQVKDADPYRFVITNRWLDGVTKVSTLAGSGVGGYRDGKATEALFNLPTGIAVHPDGSWAAVADKSNNKVRKVLVASGEVSTLIGSENSKGYQDGTNVTAKLREPSGLAFTPSGDALIIADSSNNRIRMLILKTMEVSTIAGPRVKINMCAYGTWKPAGGCTGGICLCGDKTKLGSECKTVDWDLYLETPTRLCAYGSSNKSCSNPAAPSLDACACTEPNTGIPCTSDSEGKCNQGGICLGAPGFADGTATNARFNNPTGVSVSRNGKLVYIADSNNHVVRRLDLAAATVSTLAGKPLTNGNVEGVLGAGTALMPQALFNTPTNLVAHSRDLVVVVDAFNYKVRAVSEENQAVNSLTGWLTCQGGSYISSGICYRLTKCICMENITDPKEARRCSDGSSPIDNPDPPAKPCLCTPSNNGATCDEDKECTGGGLCRSPSKGDHDGASSMAKFDQPRGIDMNLEGTFFAIADSSNNRIRLVDCGGPCNVSLVSLNLTTSMSDCDPTISICLTAGANALPAFSSAAFAVVIALHTLALW